jgi:hypothetical protein
VALAFGTCGFLRGLRGKWRILGVGWAGGYCHFGLLVVNVVIVDTLSIQEQQLLQFFLPFFFLVLRYTLVSCQRKEKSFKIKI